MELIDKLDEETCIYLDTLTPPQRRRWEALYRTQPTDVRTDLICPDCGHLLKLRLGRFGRFYGCETYEDTGCRGGVSARDDGSPVGPPACADERQLRKQLVALLKEPVNPERQRFRLTTVLRYTRRSELKIVELSKAELEKAIEIATLCNQSPALNRWDRLRIESLLPTEG